MINDLNVIESLHAQSMDHISKKVDTVHHIVVFQEFWYKILGFLHSNECAISLTINQENNWQLFYFYNFYPIQNENCIPK